MRTVQEILFQGFGTLEYDIVLFTFYDILSRTGYIIYRAQWKLKCSALCSKTENLRWQQQNLEANMRSISSQNTPMKPALSSWDQQVTCHVPVYIGRDQDSKASLMVSWKFIKETLIVHHSAHQKIALEVPLIQHFYTQMRQVDCDAELEVSVERHRQYIIKYTQMP